MVSPVASRPVSVRGREPAPLAYLLLYIPVVFAWLFASDPVLSFGIAWAGSWWILWVSMTGRVRALPSDRPWNHQLFRPLFLSQAMFFGLFCMGTVFHMWDLAMVSRLGRQVEEIQRTAAAQRYYLLAHAAFVHGILALMDYRRSGEWSVQFQLPLSRLFLYAAGMSFALSFLMEIIPGVGQFAGKLETLSAAGVILGVAYAVRKGDRPMILVGLGLYGFLLYNVLLSGWKSRVVTVTGLLLVALYPRYKKTTVVAGIAAVLLFGTLLPAYNSIFRKLNWSGEMQAERAAQVAIARVMSDRVDVAEESEAFLENRLSTVSIFTDYIQNVPSRRPYYGLSTVEQAAYSIIPRVLWPGKPNTEELVTIRVVENTSVRPGVRVSVKPPVVMDGYLAGGAIGVFLACFLLGCVVSIASRYAERWFGGYVIGGQFVYTGLFARTVFTPSFEFLFNSIFWAFVLMGGLAVGLREIGILVRSKRSPSDQRVTYTVNPPPK